MEEKLVLQNNVILETLHEAMRRIAELESKPTVQVEQPGCDTDIFASLLPCKTIEELRQFGLALDDSKQSASLVSLKSFAGYDLRHLQWT